MSALASVAMVALLGYALLLGLTVRMQALRQRPITLITLPEPPQAPPPRPQPKEKPKHHAAAPASPPNLRNKAAAMPPLPLPIISPPVPHIGIPTVPGTADQAGPGQGAGGRGNGTGSGGDGNGDGGGAGDIPPRLIRGSLRFSDMPADLRETGIGRTVGVRYHVETNGRVDDCSITASSGSAELDAVTCQLIDQRFRYDPSRTADGQKVRSTIIESHSWVVDRDDDHP